MIEVHHGWDKTHIDISHNGTQIKTIEHTIPYRLQSKINKHDSLLVLSEGQPVRFTIDEM